jgi:hypothetical protein
MEVSAKKSTAIASKYSLAVSAVAAIKSKKLQAARQAKMLGVPAGGGRRRAVKHLKVRITALKKRIPRIHILRRSGVRTAILTRAAGTPMITYGVEVVGMGDTHLQDARSAIARAAAPQGGGKNPDMVLHALDAGGGSLDPAFDAHVLPIQTWALAWWQQWQPAAQLCGALEEAILKLSSARDSVWRRVVGPATTLVASAWRMGWTFRGSTALVDDLGQVYDVTLDPPVVVADAARRSVRRWRFKRICKIFPSLVPGAPDMVAASRPDDDKGRGWSSAGAEAIVIDMSDALGRLLRPGKASCKLVKLWERADAPYLLSAVSGGQWPQARLAATRKWVDDSRCQLCMTQTGTLDHRHSCDATRPLDGWQAAPGTAVELENSLCSERRLLLRTRGLLALKVVVPPAVRHDTFEWLRAPPPDGDSGTWVWYIDGSLVDEPRRFARRTGFAIVVLGEHGELVAFGFGRPPTWAMTAAAAEAWAYYKVVADNPSPPTTVTDCLEVLKTLTGGWQAASGGKMRLARVWRMTFGVLEDQAELAASRLEWMPAHTAMAAIGVAKKSSGRTVTARDWRANRLVDVLAKAAAVFDRIPPGFMKRVEAAGTLAEHAAAMLGVVTRAANNYKVEFVRSDGSTACKNVRDSCPPPRRECGRKRQREHVEAPHPEEAAEAPAITTLAGAIGSSVRGAAAPGNERSVRRRRATTTALARQDRLDAECVARWIDEHPPMVPRVGAPAEEVMAQLRERIRAKQALSRLGSA